MATRKKKNLAESIRLRFAPFGGVELEIPRREHAPTPPVPQIGGSCRKVFAALGASTALPTAAPAPGRGSRRVRTGRSD